MGSAVIALSCLVVPTVPARAQSLDEMKRMLQSMQRRIDQLEAAQRAERLRAAAPPRGGRAATAASSAQVQAAQRAAEEAQRSAQQAQQAVTQARQEAAQAKQVAADEVKAAYAPAAGKPSGSFKIRGTTTTVRLHGFAKANAFWDTNGGRVPGGGVGAVGKSPAAATAKSLA